jgi:hypothetical protein
MERIPLATQTTYADLLTKLLDEQIGTVSTKPGNFTFKTIKGRRYWYRQFTEAGTRKQVYVGPETPELLDRIREHAELAETSRVRRALVRSMTAGGTGSFVPAVPRVGKVLEALADAGVFRLRGVLIGTVAFGCYGQMLGVRLKSSSLMTGDIDIAQFRSISIAVEDQIPPVLEALRRVDPSFEPLTSVFHGSTPAGYTTRTADPLRVEFLTPMRGPEEDAPGELPALQTHAQPLRFLDYLIHNERPAAYLYRAGVLINIPDPARFAWHKLIVAERRSVREKVAKDLHQAQSLFEVLVRDYPGDVLDMFHQLEGPGRVMWKNIALAGLAKIDTAVSRSVWDIIIPSLVASKDETQNVAQSTHD